MPMHHSRIEFPKHTVTKSSDPELTRVEVEKPGNAYAHAQEWTALSGGHVLQAWPFCCSSAVVSSLSPP